MFLWWRGGREDSGEALRVSRVVGSGFSGNEGVRFFCKRSGTVQWLLVIIKRIQSIEVEKMSPMTNEIKCYICMISCIFIEQIFMVVYTMSKCTSHNCLIMKMKEKKKNTVTFFCECKYTVFVALFWLTLMHSRYHASVSSCIWFPIDQCDIYIYLIIPNDAALFQSIFILRKRWKSLLPPSFQITA